MDVPRRARQPVGFAPGDKQVSLTWDDPSNSSITRYEYQQTTTGSCSGGWTQMTGSDASTTQHVVKSLTNGNAYTFCVRAYSEGNGAASTKATATPQPAPAAPTSVSASADGHDVGNRNVELRECLPHRQVPGALPRGNGQLEFVVGRGEDGGEVLLRQFRP